MPLQAGIYTLFSRFFKLFKISKKTAETPKNSTLILVSKRSRKIPKTWRVVDDAGTNYVGIQNTEARELAIDLWSLTLSSRFIPHKVSRERKIDSETGIEEECLRLFVPALWENIAREELFAFTTENTKPIEIPHQVHATAKYTLLALLPLIFFHGIYSGWFPLPFEHVPDVQYWLLHGKLEAYRLRAYEEWWRGITALSLHVDSLHLFGNILFSALFLNLLSRRVGLGFAVFFAIGAAFFANITSVYLRPNPYSSVGFSTALFAMIGMLCGDMFVYSINNSKHRILAFLPLCAGAGLLAMLGTQGERTDYLAHILGLVWGIVIGMFLAFLLKKIKKPLPYVNIALYLFVILLFIYSWVIAFQETQLA